MKRPWNLVDVPVYSLATYKDRAVNMNICTYVSAVSMKPKLYMLAIDYHTKTFENLVDSERAVLQVLHRDHAALIPLLGKKSGKRVNKAEKLAQRNCLSSWQGHQVLQGACAYLQMKKMHRATIGGDHELFYFEVEKSTTRSENNVLMFQELVAQGIILS